MTDQPSVPPKAADAEAPKPTTKQALATAEELATLTRYVPNEANSLMLLNLNQSSIVPYAKLAEHMPLAIDAKAMLSGIRSIGIALGPAPGGFQQGSALVLWQDAGGRDGPGLRGQRVDRAADSNPGAGRRAAPGAGCKRPQGQDPGRRDIRKAASKAPGTVGKILRSAKPTIKGDTVSVVYTATAEQASALTFEF